MIVRLHRNWYPYHKGDLLVLLKQAIDFRREMMWLILDPQGRISWMDDDAEVFAWDPLS